MCGCESLPFSTEGPQYLYGLSRDVHKKKKKENIPAESQRFSPPRKKKMVHQAEKAREERGGGGVGQVLSKHRNGSLYVSRKKTDGLKKIGFEKGKRERKKKGWGFAKNTVPPAGEGGEGNTAYSNWSGSIQRGRGREKKKIIND